MAYLDAAGRGECCYGNTPRGRVAMDGWGQWKVPGRVRFEDGNDVIDYFRSSAGYCIGDTASLVVTASLPLARY